MSSFRLLVEQCLFEDQTPSNQYRKVIKQKYPKLQFSVKTVGFSDLARGSTIVLEVKNAREAIEEYGFGLRDDLIKILKQDSSEKIIVRMDTFFTKEDVDRINAKFK